MAPSAVIFGCSGPALTSWERGFFAEVDPLGFILFARNCDNPDQVRRLVADLRASVGRDEAPVLIDQEGGRVARLKPPHWRKAPAAGLFADLAAQGLETAVRAARLNANLIAGELSDLGIDVDCWPLLDLPIPGASDVIGDRAFGTTAAQVTALARATAAGLLEGGVMPVIKHIPGHGRALVDSHKDLPRVNCSLADLQANDFVPFRAMADAGWAMTAHVIYDALDPEHPATTSPKVIGEVIRQDIGFDGLLISDDLSMKALSGSFEQRAIDCLNAGCDLVLHCNGRQDEMEAVACGVGPMTEAAVQRFARAKDQQAAARQALDMQRIAADLDQLIRQG